MPASGTILLVDDDDLFREVLEGLLSREGYKILTASNGLEGLDVFAKNPEIKIIISDVRMPQMDGLTFLKTLRANNKKIPFFVITGFSEELTKQDPIKLGANGYLTKPFDRHMILSQLSNILKG